MATSLASGRNIRLARVSEKHVGTGLKFERAELADTAAVQAAYRGIIEHLAATIDYPRWHSENHPGPDLVAEWVQTGNLYVARDTASGRIAGLVALDHNAPGGYADAAWGIEAAPEQALIVHALGVTPEFQHRGVARFLIREIIGLARARGCLAVRLDVYTENTPGIELYRQCGFTDLGLHQLHYDTTDLSEFRLYEYVVG